jgi:uncharacterized protein YlxW (UPF0749 family)
MNPFEMVAIIVVAVMIASVLRARYRAGEGAGTNPQLEAENLRLRDDVKQLKQRVKVLEQIVTDRGADTAAQIEALRERDKISEGDQG